MNLRRLLFVLVPLALLLTACGFHARKEVEIPASMQRIHIQNIDPFSQLARDLDKTLARSGVQIVDKVEDGVAVMTFSANSISTDVLTVGGNARANEYAMRYRVQFHVSNAAGSTLLAPQSIELTRSFVFDSDQALGVAAQQDLLTRELQRDMVQAILRRLEALADKGD